MKHSFVVLCAAIAASAASLSWTGRALAAETESDSSSSSSKAGVSSDQNRYGDAPSKPLLGGGIFIFAMSYLPAVAVAGSSERPIDQRLFVPVAGPWMDLANRGPCNPVGCSSEMAYRSLLVTDGILQGLGAFMTLVGILGDDDPPATGDDARRDQPARVASTTVHVSPVQFGSGGYGLAAFGNF